MEKHPQKRAKLNFLGIWFLYASYYFVFGTLSPNIDSIVASISGATRSGISLLNALQLTINIISLIFFGAFSDKMTEKLSRKKVLIIANLLILSGTISVVFSQNFLMFFIPFQLIALGSGSFMAIAFPIISDSFELKDRGKVFGLMQFSLLFGAGGGMLIGSLIGGIGLTSWRYAYSFGAVLISGSIIIYSIFGYDPKRGSSDPEFVNLAENISYGYKMSFDSIKNILKSKTILLSFISVICLNIAHTTLGVWGIPFLNSKINPESNSLFATLLVVLSGFGGLFGSIIGGRVGDSLYKKKKSRGRILLSTFVVIIGELAYITFYLIIPYDKSSTVSGILSFTMMMIFGLIGSFFVFMRTGNVYAIYSECCLPEERAIANSFNGLMVQVGGIIGNIIVFFLVDNSLLLAISVILTIGLLSSLPQALMYITCNKEARACRDIMEQRSAKLMDSR
ncbi:MAG: MFS transporter [Candidatus Hodarchaeota archaeon]